MCVVTAHVRIKLVCMTRCMISVVHITQLSAERQSERTAALVVASSTRGVAESGAADAVVSSLDEAQEKLRQMTRELEQLRAELPRRTVEASNQAEREVLRQALEVWDEEQHAYRRLVRDHRLFFVLFLVGDFL